ncbi:hypothetical protein [Nocardioides coralli]|uniref:hypothetical protein n=1 Tax=Nocardioides coralli TaxID=2872154 RepID=UPI001CA46024|nr:hypothetical protein [Nocardioides coralli]QZY28923.1 hypothetical protein K6T13_15990 [Nocardioides coralli]
MTTAAEVVTAPYGELRTLVELNPAVHVLKLVAVAVFVAGMLSMAARHGQALGRVGFLAAGAVAAGTAAGAGPYSAVEVLIGTDGGAAAVESRLEAAYSGWAAWVPPLAMVGLPLFLLGLVALAGVVLRHRLLPWWRPALSLAAIPVAVLGAMLGGLGLPVPHPPTWLFLGIAVAYAAPLRARPPERRPTRTGSGHVTSLTA